MRPCIQEPARLIPGYVFSGGVLFKFLSRAPRVHYQEVFKLLRGALPRSLVSCIGDKESLAVYLLVMKQRTGCAN